MALYLVSYDITESSNFDYQPLWDKLKEMDATRILFSEWLVIDAPGLATSIYNQIAPKVAKDDRLLVQEVTNDAEWDQLLISNEAFGRLLSQARG